MKIITTCEEMQRVALQLRQDGKKIHFVPTMGALHEGHLSLVDRAIEDCAVVVMSIFVNPKQFGKNEDLHKYPRPFETDCEKAESRGCDIIFAPAGNEMYPNGYGSTVALSGSTELLEGAARPGHFDGVTTVVLKLFNIVQCTKAIFGQKDAQQATVIQQMVTDLNLPVEIDLAPIVREEDGLALSSRNVYLTEAERREVNSIFKGLQLIHDIYKNGNCNSEELKQTFIAYCDEKKNFTVEYVEIVSKETFRPINLCNQHAYVLTACRTTESKTRLIDNILLL